MKTKTCCICNSAKSLTEFNKNRSRKDGLQSRCRDCDKKHAIAGYYSKYKKRHIERAYQRKRDLRAWLTDLKKTKACLNCNERRWYVLDFHHADLDKEDNVASLLARGCSKERILKEIDKCEVLCSNCHRELHYLENC